MNDRKKKKDELKNQSAEAAKRADELLENELEALKQATTTDLESLRPHVADEETYNKLIEVVEESTRNNESLAQLKERIEKLGEIGLSMAKRIIQLLG